MRVFPTKTVYKIGNGDEKFCTFDFSIIPVDQYNPLFNSFPNFLFKKVQSISFNCNFEYQYQNLGRKSTKREEIISQSIANLKPKFIPYLAKIMKNVLPVTKKLTSIEFSSVNIGRAIMPQILTTLATSKQIETIVFKNVPTNDDHFIRFLGSASPYVLKNVAFINCGLSSVSFPAIKNFLKQRPSKSSKMRKLQVFDVSGNNFTHDEFMEIINLLRSSDSIKKHESDVEDDVPIDGSYSYYSSSNNENISINASSAKPSDANPQNKPPPPRKLFDSSSSGDIIQNSEPENESKEQDELNKKVSDSSDDQQQKQENIEEEEEEEIESVDSVESDVPSDVEALKDQNMRLKKELKYILKQKQGVMYADDIFVLGQQGKELVEVVKLMKEQISSLKELEAQSKNEL